MSSPASDQLPHSPVRVLAGLVLPIAVFVVLLRVLGNATGALAITDAIPLLWLIAYGIWRRRIEPLALIPAAVFALALVLTIAFGGNALPLELRRSVLPGAIGLGCLISLVLGRPLLAEAAIKLSGRSAEDAAETRANLTRPGAQRALTVMTAIIGVTATIDAVAQIVLALTVSAATFGVVARIASWAIIGTGLAVAVLYVRHVRARLQQGRPT